MKRLLLIVSIISLGFYGIAFAELQVIDGPITAQSITVNNQITIKGGSPGAGKVLTSDATGLATWQVATGSSLPAGTSGQTLRHDGSAWIANNILFNNGTNVGIGTSSPSYKLDIAGPLNLNKGLTGVALTVNGSEALWFTGSYFSWGFGGTANYFADTIGVGTTDLSTVRLNNGVLHNIAAGEGLLQVSNNDSADAYSDTLILKRPGQPNTHEQGILFADANSMQAAIRAKRVDGMSNYWSNLSFYTQNDGTDTFHSDATAKMVIDHAGNVGIGTTNPTRKLSVVAADSETLLGLSGSSSSHASIALGRTAAETRLAIVSAAGLYSASAVAGDAVLRVDNASQKLHIQAGAGGAPLTVTSTNVGIGTSNPTERLHVAGDIKVDGALFVTKFYSNSCSSWVCSVALDPGYVPIYARGRQAAWGSTFSGDPGGSWVADNQGGIVKCVGDPATGLTCSNAYVCFSGCSSWVQVWGMNMGAAGGMAAMSQPPAGAQAAPAEADVTMSIAPATAGAQATVINSE